MKWLRLYKEERYAATPFPEYRWRLQIFCWAVTLWRWDG